MKKRKQKEDLPVDALETDNQEPPPAPDTSPPAPPAQLEEPPPVIPTEEELPPPPPESPEQARGFPELKIRKSGPIMAIRRGLTIFQKDIGTMAKHGLASAIIIFVFLCLLFYSSSFVMHLLVTTEFEEGGDGEDGPDFGNDGSLTADAGEDMSITAGTTITLSSEDTIHRDPILYIGWSISSENDDTRLFGDNVPFTFEEAGSYTVTLEVVDSSWNYDEDNFSVQVGQRTADYDPPVATWTAYPGMTITFGMSIEFDGSASSDDVAVVNWTWRFDDVIEKEFYGSVLNYTFKRAENHWVELTVRDYAGNTNRMGMDIMVTPSTPDGEWPFAEMNQLDDRYDTGEFVDLDASMSHDNVGITSYEWYIRHNASVWVLTGEMTGFPANGLGMFEVLLAVGDASGNVGVAEGSFIALPAGTEMPSGVDWESTPLGQDVSFKLLTFAYGAALLAAVIYIGGLFSKGFAHEIQKGTVKALFMGPVSVTTVMFSKILYPLVIGPVFIFPLMLIGMIPIGQPVDDVLLITLVAYAFAAVTMVSAAYGSCLIYAVTRKMIFKPTGLSKTFLYLSLICTLTVFELLSFFMDQWLETETWTELYVDIGGTIAIYSPFHQGGVLLSNMLIGTAQTPDWWLLVIPVALIAGGVFASLKLYPDLFSRE